MNAEPEYDYYISEPDIYRNDGGDRYDVWFNNRWCSMYLNSFTSLIKYEFNKITYKEALQYMFLKEL